jgi:hypothetical protein
MENTMISGRLSRIEMTDCPQCGLPAEVLDRMTLQSTDGPVEHVKTRCVTGEWFLMPVAAAQASEALRPAA